MKSGLRKSKWSGTLKAKLCKAPPARRDRRSQARTAKHLGRSEGYGC
jgi:hypothetical protein